MKRVGRVGAGSACASVSNGGGGKVPPRCFRTRPPMACIYYIRVYCILTYTCKSPLVDGIPREYFVSCNFQDWCGAVCPKPKVTGLGEFAQPRKALTKIEC